eukprot:COSAG02_NODE_27695_length_604_cov_1.334653_1_plen_69_part_10
MVRWYTPNCIASVSNRKVDLLNAFYPTSSPGPSSTCATTRKIVPCAIATKIANQMQYSPTIVSNQGQGW